jgi:ubiquinone/menaquinone biosynthesis C-methylase UbiE
MSTDQGSIDWYDEHAQDYTDHVRNPDESIYHSLYEKPAMYALLPDLQGTSVLSLGCGSGEDCEYLRRQGSSQVTGIDISKGLIEIAQSSYPRCTFQVMDMEHLDFPDASFDFAYSSLAIHYLEDWSQVLGEVYRVLKPNSYFLFSCGHPVLSAMHVSKNDEVKTKELSIRLDRRTEKETIVGDYLTHKAIVGYPNWAVTTWHKSIGEISGEATGAGFFLTDIHEPQPLPAMRKLAPRDYKALKKIPAFIVFKLFKPA